MAPIHRLALSTRVISNRRRAHSIILFFFFSEERSLCMKKEEKCYRTLHRSNGIGIHHLLHPMQHTLCPSFSHTPTVPYHTPPPRVVPSLPIISAGHGGAGWLQASRLSDQHYEGGPPDRRRREAVATAEAA